MHRHKICYVTLVFFSSVWIRGFAHVDSCRISGFVSGSVVYHCSTVPVPLGSNIRGLSSCLLRHLPSHRATHRVRWDPDCVDLTLRPVWNEGHPPVMHDDTLEQKLHWTQTKPSTHSPDTSLFIKESTVHLPAIQSQAVSGLCNQAGKFTTSYRFLLRESWNWSHCALNFCLQLFVPALDLRWYFNDSRGKTRIVEICTLKYWEETKCTDNQNVKNNFVKSCFWRIKSFWFGICIYRSHTLYSVLINVTRSIIAQQKYVNALDNLNSLLKSLLN